MEESIQESAYRDMVDMTEALLKLALPGKRFFLLACDADEHQGEGFVTTSISKQHLIFLLGGVIDELRREVASRNALASAADSEGGDHD